MIGWKFCYCVCLQACTTSMYLRKGYGTEGIVVQCMECTSRGLWMLKLCQLLILRELDSHWKEDMIRYGVTKAMPK